MDQSFVTTVSLQSLAEGSGDKKKDNALVSDLQKGYIEFNLEESEFFKGFFQVRLKGASMYVYLSPKKKSKADYVNLLQGTIQSQITVPASSYYRYSDGSTKNCNQSYVPVVYLNRIASRDFIRQPDVVGTTLYNNLSPIGKWKVFFPQIENGGMLEKVNIMDIQIDLYITAKKSKV